MADVILALTGTTSTGSAGSASPVLASALTGVSALGTFGQIVSSQTPGEALRLVHPATIDLAGVTGPIGDLVLAAPANPLAMTGSEPVVGTLRLLAPVPTIAGTGSTGVSGQLTLGSPLAAVSLVDDRGLALRSNSPQITFAGTTGTTGVMQLFPPKPQTAISGVTDTVGALGLIPAVTRLGLDGQVGSTGRLALSARTALITAEGYSGVIGAMTLTVPRVSARLVGAVEAIGGMHLVAPAGQVRYIGSISIGSNAVTYATHTGRLALSRYTNYAFNSYAQFNGVFLGANENGVFTLTGATDAGAAIAAVARVGITDFGTSYIKRVERVYVGYRADGPMILRVTVDDKVSREYAVSTLGADGLHSGRVRIGRGVEARYWQFELRNQNGADFTIDTIELKPTRLTRRVGFSGA